MARIRITSRKKGCLQEPQRQLDDNYQALLDAIIIQSAEDFRNGDMSAGKFLDSFDTGHKIANRIRKEKENGEIKQRRKKPTIK